MDPGQVTGSCTGTTPVSHGPARRFSRQLMATSSIRLCLCAPAAARFPSTPRRPTADTRQRGRAMRGSAAFQGTLRLLLPQQLFLGRAGPGRREMHCVCNGTSPKPGNPPSGPGAAARVSSRSGPTRPGQELQPSSPPSILSRGGLAPFPGAVGTGVCELGTHQPSSPAGVAATASQPDSGLSSALRHRRSLALPDPDEAQRRSWRARSPTVRSTSPSQAPGPLVSLLQQSALQGAWEGRASAPFCLILPDFTISFCHFCFIISLFFTYMSVYFTLSQCLTLFCHFIFFLDCFH